MKEVRRIKNTIKRVYLKAFWRDNGAVHEYQDSFFMLEKGFESFP